MYNKSKQNNVIKHNLSWCKTAFHQNTLFHVANVMSVLSLYQELGIMLESQKYHPGKKIKTKK